MKGVFQCVCVCAEGTCAWGVFQGVYCCTVYWVCTAVLLYPLCPGHPSYHAAQGDQGMHCILRLPTYGLLG